jgi:hypothetical protein
MTAQTQLTDAMVKWLIFLLCSQEVPGSNLGPRPDILSFHGFPQSPQANVRIVPQN